MLVVFLVLLGSSRPYLVWIVAEECDDDDNDDVDNDSDDGDDKDDDDDGDDLFYCVTVIALSW